MPRIWNLTDFSVPLPNVGKVAARGTVVVPTITSQVQHMLDVGFFSLEDPSPPLPVEPKISVPVGIMEVEVTPGKDRLFGTEDDVVVIKKPKRKKKAPKKVKKGDD